MTFMIYCMQCESFVQASAREASVAPLSSEHVHTSTPVKPQARSSLSRARSLCKSNAPPSRPTAGIQHALGQTVQKSCPDYNGPHLGIMQTETNKREWTAEQQQQQVRLLLMKSSLKYL